MDYRFSTITVAAVILSLMSSLAEARDKDRDRERTIRCESVGEKHTYCPTHTTGTVQLSKQLSRTPCERYDTWGTDGDGGGIWVRQGCRADFIVRERRGWGRRRDRDRDESATIRCASKDWGYHHCKVRGRAEDARMVRQISDTRCVRGDNWDTDRRGIWVDKGCEAEFEVR